MSNVLQFPGQVDRDALAINFFDHVLPSSGHYCACVKSGKNFKQTFHESFESLWQTLRDADRGGSDVYYAIASFSSNDRTIPSVLELKCLPLDIDYGQGHSRPGYATYEEALAALIAFCRAIDLPAPLVVKSGGGLHVYWCFKNALSRPDWQRYADGLKQACLEHGLKADFVDAAHILRPPGTFNRKLKVARAVEMPLEGLQFGPYDHWPDQLLTVTPRPVSRLPAKIPPRPAYLGAYEPSEAFPDRDLADAATLASNCGHVGEFQKSGNIIEPLWMLMAALFRYVEDGERLFHEWSKNNYPKYDYQETQGKWERAGKLTGPPKCSTLNDANPGVCAKCKYVDAIVTPLAVGVKEDVQYIYDLVLVPLAILVAVGW